MPRTLFCAAMLLAVSLGPVPDLAAMQDDPVAGDVAAIAAGPHARELDGFPVPVPPALIARDPSGRTTVRPVRLTSALRIDGTLDEAIYERIPPISDFIQNDPVEGAPSTEKTELWILFDRDNVYVTARCWDSEPGRLIANEMRRDSVNIVQSNDGFGFAFDTFHDRRNSIAFEVSAAGGRIDAQVTNERQVNLDWNPVWKVTVGRFSGGWTMEAAIPFKSLRYRAGREQVWGFNARRIIRWKNEVTYMVPIPASMSLRGHFVASLMPTLMGLEAPGKSRTLEIKPYAISQLTTDRVVSPQVSNDLGGDVGVDLKVGLTDGLTTDLTYNTDFAQVEADEQQVNLTRFSLFFPEKREFFLENQGVFAFGGNTAGNPNGGGGGGGGGGSGGSVSQNTNDTPVLFYSRRIGLANGRPIPIYGGGRLSGRAGRYSVGLINIESGKDETVGAVPTNFTVARIRRDIFRKSNFGALVTNRSVAQNGRGANQAFGFDTTLGFYDNLTVNAYWARTQSDGLTGDDTSYRAQLDYSGDRYGVQAERLVVGANFSPEVGFVRRLNMRRNYGMLRFSPRPKASKQIRRYYGVTSLLYVENGAGRLETRALEGELALELQSNDRVFVAMSDNYEFLPAPFTIAPGVTLPVQAYQFQSVRAGFIRGPQRRIAGSFSVEHGTFYSGHRTAFTWTRGRAYVTPQLSFEPRISIDRVELVEGAFTNQLFGTRATYTVTPMMFVSALVQYNSTVNQASANVRLRWEYRPGSELFVVWNEQRDTVGRQFAELANRSFVVKINRLLRF